MKITEKLAPSVLFFKYGHTFLPDIVCERASRVSVGGFHHDYLGKIEKTGILNITKVAENAYGCYKIEWSYLNARAKYSTMFPQWWSREKVMTSIQEAVNNTYFYKLDGAEHIFRGKCFAEFNIEFIVDAGGTVVSAYPLM